MPKMAATLLGLALVVFSIGFNTARYPIVWGMVGSVGQPAAASAPASIAPPQPVQPENPAPVEPQPSPAVATQAQVEVKPVPETAGEIATDPPPLAEVNPLLSANKAEPPANSGQTAALAESRKPLVPVLPTGAPKDAAGSADPAAGICRLPPVDHSGPGPGDRYTAQFFAGAVAVYPSTSNP